MTTTELPYIQTLRTLYNEGIAKLNPERDNKLTTDFPAKMGAAIFEAGCTALQDNAADRRRIAEAEALLFLIDARAGITAGDQMIAQALRKSGKPVILAANKCEGQVEPPAEAWGLGLGEAIAISAEHNLGMAELVDALAPLAPKADLPEDDDRPQPSGEDLVIHHEDVAELLPELAGGG